MTAEAARALTVVGSLSPSNAEVRDGRAALVRIRVEASQLKSDYLTARVDVARKLAGELAKGNVDLVAKYREQKPRMDQLEERSVALTFLEQAGTELWAHLRTEHVELVRQVLTEERDNLQRNRTERDKETDAQIQKLDEELATLPSASTAYASATQTPEQKLLASKSKVSG